MGHNPTEPSLLDPWGEHPIVPVSMPELPSSYPRGWMSGHIDDAASMLNQADELVVGG